MSKKEQKFKGGLAYSTNTSLKLDGNEHERYGTLEPAKQKLKIKKIDTKARGGKSTTMVENFVGTDDEMEVLAKRLKTKCGVGGSIKDGIICIQGDLVQKIKDLLIADGYGVK
jgi:translation initiation factor 1